MIAVIQVKMTQGVSLTRETLRRFAQDIYPVEVSLAQDGRGEGIRRYLGQVLDRSVYTCDPGSAAQASFLLNSPRSFEIVIETFYQGNLLNASEDIIYALMPYLRQQSIKAEIMIFCKANDAQNYVIGRVNTFFQYMRDEMKDGLMNLLIGVCLIILAHLWLKQYFQEAIAICVGLTLSVFLKMLSFFVVHQKQPIRWSVKNEQ